MCFVVAILGGRPLPIQLGRRVNTPFAELNRYLAAERRRIEFWRESKPLKSVDEIRAELQPRQFIPSVAPLPDPEKEAVSRKFWARLYAEFARDAKYDVRLLTTTTIGVAVLFLASAFLAPRVVGPVTGIAVAVVASVAAAAAGLWLTWHARHLEITSRAKEVFDNRFRVHWTELMQRHAEHMADHHNALQREQATWNDQEQRRIAIFKQRNRDPDFVKSQVASALAQQGLLSLDSLTVSAERQLSVVLQIPHLKDAIESKTKALSEKSGKVITATKSKEEKETEYEWFAAGAGLSAIVEILNSAPFYEHLQIALYSEAKSRRAYHVCGRISRSNLPTFSWATIDPRATLRKFGFRIEGGTAKKDTGKPDWLESLDRVRIDLQ